MTLSTSMAEAMRAFTRTGSRVPTVLALTGQFASCNASLHEARVLQIPLHHGSVTNTTIDTRSKATRVRMVLAKFARAPGAAPVRPS